MSGTLARCRCRPSARVGEGRDDRAGQFDAQLVRHRSLGQRCTVALDRDPRRRRGVAQAEVGLVGLVGEPDEVAARRGEASGIEPVRQFVEPLPGVGVLVDAKPAAVAFYERYGFSPLQITSSGNLGGFVQGSGIGGSFTATGGQPPYTWSANGAPAGFNLSASSGAYSHLCGSTAIESASARPRSAAGAPATCAASAP